MSSAKRILLIDDHPALRDGVGFILQLEDDFEVCGAAETAKEAIRLIEELQPDLVLLDLQLAEHNGIGILETMQDRGFVAPVIIFTTYSREEEIYQCIQLGARRRAQRGARGSAECAQRARRLVHR